MKGQAKAAKRGEREAAEGVVSSYVHSNDRIGVLVEINCETDFVARNDEFKAFARDIAIHIAAAEPRWVSEEEVPAEERQAEAQAGVTETTPGEQSAEQAEPAPAAAEPAEGQA